MHTRYLTILLFMATLLIVAAGSSLALEASPLTLVSLNSSGAQGDRNSTRPDLSADGRYVAFESEATNLVENDANGTQDIFVRDRQTRQTRRVSIATNGVEAEGISRYPAISADGRYVVFESDADNLVPGDSNRNDVFLYDLETNQLTWVSVSTDGSAENGGNEADISGDGRYVVFKSGQRLTNNDDNVFFDVFLYDRQSAQLSLVSETAGGIQESVAGAQKPTISADGRYVAFESEGDQLFPGDANDAYDILVKDLQSGEISRVSVASDGTEGNGDSRNGVISADGRYVAFESDAENLVANDTNQKRDVFVHDRESGQTRLVSVASDGRQATNTSDNPAISADSRYIAFESFDSTLVGGNDGVGDVFVHDQETGQTTLMTPDFDSFNSGNNPAISGDGRYIAFSSSSFDLVPDDDNGVTDDIFIYDRSVSPPGTGSISGRVTDLDDKPLTDIVVQAYRLDGVWGYGGQAKTDSAGNYRIEGLAVGNYQVYFFDPLVRYTAEYYDDQAIFEAATALAVLDESDTPTINAALAPASPPTDVEGEVSVGIDPATGRVIIRGPRGDSRTMTLTQTVTCDNGATPGDVTLLIDATEFPMSDVGDDRYQVTLTVPDDLPNNQGPFAVTVRYTCDGDEQTGDVGDVELYDPSGQITDIETGDPITGVVVSLYRLPGARPDSGNETNGDCRTVDTRPADSDGSFGAWSGVPAATIDAGALINPDVGLINGTQEISPTINPQITGSDGRYAWDVVEGCWYVVVEAEGYATTTSPLVGVPPAVTDLDIALAAAGAAVYLPLVVK